MFCNYLNDGQHDICCYSTADTKPNIEIVGFNNILFYFILFYFFWRYFQNG